jgi:hypothetical protein
MLTVGPESTLFGGSVDAAVESFAADAGRGSRTPAVST